ncbi:MAG: translocation/assembly module TamB domain-containing protein, partial [Woeseiaceae bacterium]|nr:translocation/assembly module TamB domain-containing protein [Woeseiaceae bacterium]
QHGRSEFVLDGNLYGSDGLSFSAEVGTLGELLPDASGAFAASGRVSLNDTGPFLRIDGESPVMTWGELHVTNLRIANDGDGIFNVLATAEDVSLGGELIESPRVSIRVAEDSQSITVEGDYREFSLDLSLAGQADRWNAPSRWDGELQGLTIAGNGDTEALLDQPARIVVASDRILMERACVTDAGGAGACLRLDWLFAERIELGASVTRLPLNTINSLRDVGFDFDQLVNGTVQWRQVFGERATGSGNISVSRGSVVSRDRPGFVVQTDTSTIAFNILEGQLFAATIDFPMPGTGKVAGQFRVLDVTNAADSEIDGELQFELSDIAILSILSPLVDTATGRLQGNVTIAGGVQAPLVSGSLALDGGSISYLPLGLHLEDINLDSTLLDSRRLDAQGSFRAGDGRGEIVSSAEYGTGAAGLEIALRGKNLTVIDVPDVQARADVDLRVGLVDETLTLGGRIFIPEARVQPQNLPSSRASVSDDVVIVAGDLPGDTKPEPASDMKMSGSVEVTLGNDVVIDLDVARATLNGSATFDWNGPPIPTANGRYGLAGEIEAFGQVLEIVEGGVRFPNVPANNPYLRIRAEREIYGNSQVKTAGVLVDGTLARPTIDAYTYPATTEERALTLLVTGSDFNYEQGVGAVDFGTYVAPRLFVSYGVGLFGRDNVISARYDLARGFGIKATSGQTESGIDIIYRFER